MGKGNRFHEPVKGSAKPQYLKHVPDSALDAHSGGEGHQSMSHSNLMSQMGNSGGGNGQEEMD